MARSELVDQYLLHTWQLTEKKFKEQYKKEEEKPFKGNVAQYLTVGVIQRKGIPDYEDLVTIMRPGCLDSSDDAIAKRVGAWLLKEGNSEKGIAGAFCEVCNTFRLDIPVHEIVNDQIKNMEDNINKRLEAMNQINKMLESLNGLKDKLTETKNKAEATLKENEKLGVDNKDTQEDK